MNNNKKEIPVNLIVRMIAVAAAYFVFGVAGLEFAVPPGYATVIWPASGIALGLALLWGYWVWPGVLLGSFIVNIIVGLNAGVTPVTLQSLIIPFLIGCGAALQAIVGRFLIVQFAGFPNKLANEKDVFIFLIWAGPASCLVNSIWGSSVLFAAGVIPESNLILNFGTWWLGDVIGVVIFMPLVLVWFSPSDENWKARRNLVTFPTLIAFVTTIGLVAMSANSERDQIKLKFNQQAAPVVEALKKTLSNNMKILNVLEVFYLASNDFNRESFRIFSQKYFSVFEGPRALSWNPVVPHNQLSDFERKVKQEGFPDFFAKQRGPDGKLIPVVERDKHIIVKYIEPFQTNKAAFGFDVASNPVRKAALDQARDGGKPVSTGRLNLVQGLGDEGYGILVFFPVFKNKLPTDTVETRRRNLLGYMVGVFQLKTIIETALQGLDLDGVIFELVDENAIPEKQMLYKNIKNEKAIYRLEDKGVFGGAVVVGTEVRLDFGERQWKLKLSPSQQYLALNRQQYTWTVLVGGMVLTSFICISVLVMSGRREYLQHLVDKQTRKLQLSESRLAQAQRIARLGNWEWDVETHRLWLSDECYEILELQKKDSDAELETLLGYVHPDDFSTVKQAYEKALYNEAPFKTEHRIILSQGRVKYVHQSGDVVRDNAGKLQRVVGTIQDITDRSKLDRMKQEFVSSVSHELRTPLTSIKGSLEIISSGKLGDVSEEVSSLLDLAIRNTTKLIYLVNDILDVGKLESAGLSMKMQSININDIVRETVDLNKGLANKRGIEFICNDAQQNICVKGDANRIAQVITNLLSNAVKFSPDKGRVDVNIKASKGVVEVSITDQGPGIPRSFYDRIFNRFSQADSSDSRSAEGTGLGLSISKLIVEKHGGNIGFSSQVGRGSTFYFTLPISNLQEPEA